MDSDSIQRRRAERARQRQRRAARRRLIAGSALVLAAVVIVAIAISATSGSSPAARTTAGHSSPHRGGRGAASRARAHRGSTAAALGPATGHPGTARVPILMYHVINVPPPGAPFPGLYVPAPEFAAQMAALKRAGWTGVTLDQLRAYWQHGARLPPGKPIVITFDNGYQSQYRYALPVLKRMGWVADENIQLAGLPPSQGGLVASQVKAMIAAGWELDTQGISHADLIALDAAGLRYQIDTARQRLRREYHVPVNWFCYPSGHYDASVIAAVRAAGFIGSTTVVPGWAAPTTDPFELPRLRVLGGTSPSALLAQIASNSGSFTPPASYGGA